ncbi:MAG TPA: hypothetical protein VHD91_12560 [Gaiellaceae bacterium]|nr:hypothetical protein [Gaiellaceae bacterium]
MRNLIAALKQLRTNVGLAIALLEAGDQDGASEMLEAAETDFREALDRDRSAA